MKSEQKFIEFIEINLKQIRDEANLQEYRSNVVQKKSIWCSAVKQNGQTIGYNYHFDYKTTDRLPATVEDMKHELHLFLTQENRHIGLKFFESHRAHPMRFLLKEKPEPRLAYKMLTSLGEAYISSHPVLFKNLSVWSGMREAQEQADQDYLQDLSFVLLEKIVQTHACVYTSNHWSISVLNPHHAFCDVLKDLSVFRIKPQHYSVLHSFMSLVDLNQPNTDVVKNKIVDFLECSIPTQDWIHFAPHLGETLLSPEDNKINKKVIS